MRNREYRQYLLVLLLLIYAFNSVDTQALGLLLQNIKSDLRLSDTQLGVLTGIAYALFYSVMGIPLARWADRGDRRLIISLTTGLWSVAVALCGAAQSFAQLLAVRVLVGVGEAGCFPPAQSLLADYFRRKERPRAFSIYMLGSPLSVVIGYFLAGWINEYIGWRRTFMVLGAPSLIAAIVAYVSLREPRRTQVAARTVATRDGDGPRSEIAAAWTLMSSATFRHLLIANSVGAFFGAGMAQWLPSYLMRSFGLKTGEIGAWLAVLYGLGGLAGTYLGGELASRLAGDDEPLQLKGIAAAYIAMGLLSVAAYSSHSLLIVAPLIGIVGLGVTMISGPMFAAIQAVSKPDMRATSVAIVLFFSNLIGVGFGPLLVGFLSDRLVASLGSESLRYAMLCMCPGYLWVAVHFVMASKTIARDAAAVGASVAGG